MPKKEGAKYINRRIWESKIVGFDAVSVENIVTGYSELPEYDTETGRVRFANRHLIPYYAQKEVAQLFRKIHPRKKEFLKRKK